MQICGRSKGKLDPERCTLKINGKVTLELSTPFRLANLPSSAKLELVHEPLATPAAAPTAAPVPQAASASPTPVQQQLAPPPPQAPAVVAAAAAPTPRPPRPIQPPPVITEGVWPAPFKFPESSTPAAPTTSAPRASSATAAAAVIDTTEAMEADESLTPLERELGRPLRVVLPEQSSDPEAETVPMDVSDDFYEYALGLASPDRASCRACYMHSHCMLRATPSYRSGVWDQPARTRKGRSRSRLGRGTESAGSIPPPPAVVVLPGRGEAAPPAVGFWRQDTGGLNLRAVFRFTAEDFARMEKAKKRHADMQVRILQAAHSVHREGTYNGHPPPAYVATNARVGRLAAIVLHCFGGVTRGGCGCVGVRGQADSKQMKTSKMREKERRAAEVGLSSPLEL